MTLVRNVLNLTPGLAVAFTTSQVGFLLAHEMGMTLLKFQGVAISPATQSPISGIPVSIILGILFKKNILDQGEVLPKVLKPGLQAACKPVLQTGIVCVGAKLSALDLVTTGAVGLPCVLASVGTGMTFIPWFANYLGLSKKLGSLVAAGTSICGVTAISAVSPAIKASSHDSSLAIANVVTFGTIGMLTMPYVAHALLPASQQAGLFLGLSVHDTSQVLGSALTYSTVYADEAVVKVAAITKLSRNLLLAGVVPYLTLKHVHIDATKDNQKIGKRNVPKFNLSSLKQYTPTFVLGFIAMSCLRSAGDFSLMHTGGAFFILDKTTWSDIYNFIGGPLGSQYLLGTALAGVGLTTKFSFKGVGHKPFLLGFTGASVVAGTGLTTSLLIGYFL